MNESASQEPRDPRRSPVYFGTPDRVAVAVILALAIIFGILAAVYNPLLHGSPSREGAAIDHVFSLALGVAAAIATIVEGALIFIIIRYRRRPGDTSEGWPVRHYLPVEIVWTIIPILIVTGLAYASYQALVFMGSPTLREAGGVPGAPVSQELTIEVTGRQFAWEFHYPDQNLTSNVMHVPVGQHVTLKMRSADVIHAFWVPGLRIKRDVNPDRETQTLLTATAAGEFPIVCSRFCGAGHTFMRSLLVVDQPADFQTWVVQQAKQAQAQPQTGATDPIAYGRQLFQHFGCGGCHTLADAGANGQAGSNLNGIGTQAATRKPGEDAQAYLRESIDKPEAYIVQGYSDIMPHTYPQQLKPEELNALVQYLAAQK